MRPHRAVRVRVCLFPLSTLLLSEQPEGEPDEAVQATTRGVLRGLRGQIAARRVAHRPVTVLIAAHCLRVLAQWRHTAAAST